MNFNTDSNSNSNVKVVRIPCIGFCSLLTLIFITLKLTNVINWSWIWVLSPLWIGWSVMLIVIILVLIICALLYR